MEFQEVLQQIGLFFCLRMIGTKSFELVFNSHDFCSHWKILCLICLVSTDILLIYLSCHAFRTLLFTESMGIHICCIYVCSSVGIWR
jgi:mRNA-degrading endonuclease YafQ of YafQ-DinJ toxin-antitoxin module